MVPFNPQTDLPPWWVVPVTWSPGDGSTSTVAGVPTARTVETFLLEFRAAGTTTAAQSARALAMAKDQCSRTNFDSAVYGEPYPGRA